MPKSVYVILASSGEYDEFMEVPVAVVEDQAEANRLVADAMAVAGRYHSTRPECDLDWEKQDRKMARHHEKHMNQLCKLVPMGDNLRDFASDYHTFPSFRWDEVPMILRRVWRCSVAGVEEGGAK